MKRYDADAAALRLLQRSALVPAGLLCIASVFLPAPLPILMCSAAVICALLGEIWLVQYFRRLHCTIGGGRLSVTGGVVIRRRQSVPLQRIRSVRLTSAPLGREGLHFLTVFFYGGRLTVPFLRQADCRELITVLQEGGGTDAP